MKKKIQDEARRYLGVRWRHQGRSIDSGVDCVGLVVNVAKDLGLASCDCDVRGYQRRSVGYEFTRHFERHMDKVSVSEMCPGDVLLFADMSFPCHCAICTENEGVIYIIHANAKRKSVVEERFTEDWKSKLTHVFRFRR